MARRRVNTKALVIFGSVVLVAIATVIVLAGPGRKLFGSAKSEDLAREGDALMEKAAKAETSDDKKDKLSQAAQKIQAALTNDPKNAKLYVKFGDCLSKLAQFDLYQNIRASRQAWDRALELEPGNIDALTRLMDSYYAEAQLGSTNVNTFAQLKDRAGAIAKLQPDNVRANALLHIAPLHQWLLNIETPAKEIDDALAALESLREKDAGNADIIFYISASQAKRGSEAKRTTTQDQQAKDYFDASLKTFEEALKAPASDGKTQADVNGYMHYRFFEVLSLLRAEDRERETTKKYTEKTKLHLDKARAMVKSGDSNFVKVQIAAHEHAARLRGDFRKQAEDILLTAQELMRKDQRIRITLAKFWKNEPDPNLREAKREAAIKLLEMEIEDIGFEGVEAQRRIGLEIETYAELANMYIEDFAMTRPTDREGRLKQIEATYDKVANKAGERSMVLKLRGKIELLRGGADAPIKAIQTFEKAQAQHRTERNGAPDLEITHLLAKAYYAARQTGQAKKELDYFVNRAPDYLPARLMLAQLLVEERDVKMARPHVEFLEKQAPEQPEVIRLVLATLNPETEKPKITAMFGKLPEATRDQIMGKALIAKIDPVNNLDEAARLYRIPLSAEPADFEALNGLREVLLQQGKKEEAIAALKAGLAAKPDDEKIALILKQLEGASTADIAKWSKELLEKMFKDDPFGLALKMYEFELVAVAGERDPVKLKEARLRAFKHLEQAEKLKPNDNRVLDIMFQYYLTDGNWARCEEYVNKLEKINADQAGGLIYRFRLAMTKGDTQSALQHGRDLTNKLPEFARSYILNGQALQAAGQYDSAIQNYGMALDKQAENVDALAGIITSYQSMKRPNDAYRYIQQAVKAHPSHPFFKQQRTAHILQYGDPKEVLAESKAARDANPKDPGRWLSLGRVQLAAARKGDAQSAEYLADAKKTFTEALKQWPNEKIIYAFLSETAEVGKDFAGGEALLKDMATKKEFVGSADPVLLLADFYMRFGKPVEAEAAMTQGIATLKNNMELKRRLAAFYTQNRKYDEALKLLDPASDDSLIRQQIVEIYMLNARFTDAEKLLRGLLLNAAKDKDAVKEAQLHALLGVVLLNQARQAQAMESVNTALSLDPKNQAALYSRGQMRLKLSPPQIDDAIRDFQALRDVNPSHVEARVGLADALRQRANPEAAAKELEAAMVVAPSRKDVRTALVGMYAAMKPPAWSDAERVLDEAEKSEPDDSSWKRMSAKMASVRQQHEKAATKIREAIGIASVQTQRGQEAFRAAKTDPEREQIKGELARLEAERGDLVRDYFDILESWKNWPQLLAECDQLFAASAAAKKEAWWVHVKRAIANRYLDRKEEALKDFQNAFEIGQTQSNPDILVNIVDQIAKHLDLQVAIDRATRLAANDVRWKVVLAYLYMTSGNHRRATELIEEARLQFTTGNEKLGPRDKMTTLNVAGTIYMTTQEWDKAREVYEQLLETSKGENLGALNNLACLYAEFVNPPNLARALEYSTKAQDMMLRRGAKDPNILDTHGWVNVLTGGANLDKGKLILEESLSAGAIPEAHYHMGEFYLRKDKSFANMAIDQFNKAQELIAAMPPDKQDKNLRKKIDDAMMRAEQAKAQGPQANNP